MTGIQEPREGVFQIRQALAQGESCRLWVTGTSMVPFLRSEKDAVILKPFDGQAQRGDLLFYSRPNGQHILHRVYKTYPDGSFLMCGDNQTFPERVQQEQVIAAVAAIHRRSRRFPQSHPLWKLLSGIWMGLFFMRPVLLKLMHGLWKILKG